MALFTKGPGGAAATFASQALRWLLVIQTVEARVNIGSLTLLRVLWMLPLVWDLQLLLYEVIRSGHA